MSDITSKATESPEIEDLTASDDEDVSNLTKSSPQSVRGSSSSQSPVSKRSESLEIVETFSGPKGLTEDQVVEDLSNMRKSPTAGAHAGNAHDPVVVDSEDDHDSEKESDEDMSDISEDSSDSEEDSAHIIISDSESDSDAEQSSEENENDEKKVRKLSDNTGIAVSHLRTRLDRESEANSSLAAALYSEISDDELMVGDDILDDSEDNDSEDNDSVEYNDSVESVMGDAGVSYQVSVAESGSDEESTADLSSDDDSDTGVVNLSAVSKYEIMEKALASENEKEKESSSSGMNPLPVKPNWNSSIFARPSTESPAPQSTPVEGMSGNEARTSFGREPSPSDAAMVKEGKAVASAIESTSNVEVPERIIPNPSAVPQWHVEVSNDVSRPQQNSFVHSMGEKTGKADFFQAREENKEKLEAKIETMMGKLPSQAPGPASVARPKWVPQSIQTPPLRSAFGSVVAESHSLNEARRENIQQQPQHFQHQQSLQVQHAALQQQVQHHQQLHAAHHAAQHAAIRAHHYRQLEQQAARQRQQDAQQLQRRAQQQRAIEHLVNAQKQQRNFAGNAETPRFFQPVNVTPSPMAVTQHETVDPRSLSQHAIRDSNPFSTSTPRSSNYPMRNMTSTATSAASKDAEKAPEKGPARSSVPISNLVNSDDEDDDDDDDYDDMPGLEPIYSRSEPEQSNKRKADDISDLSDEEVAVEKSKKINVPLCDTTRSADVPTSEETTSSSNSSASSLASPVVTNEPVVHRAKRFKIAAEKVGYAALGGVLGGAAVGAGLFAALVMTAPDFV